MNFILILSTTSAFLLFACVTPTDLLDSSDELKPESLSGYCNSTSPSYCHLQYFLQYAAFGKPNLNRTNIFDLIESLPDSIDLLSIIILASQNFNEYLNDNGYNSDTFEEYWTEWIQVIQTLAVGGPGEVTLGQLKPYINALRPENLLEFWRTLDLKRNNLQDYIDNEFLAKIETPECRSHVGLWFQDIKERKLWAIEMFDNIGKPPTGILKGNINWVGSYKSCKAIEVSKENSSFHGKYCRTSLSFNLDSLAVPDFGISQTLIDSVALNIGICVPNQCTNKDVEIITQKTLELLAVYKLLNVKKVSCDDPVSYSTGFICVTIILSLICASIVCATTFDCVYRVIQSANEETDEDNKKTNKSTTSKEEKVSEVKPISKKGRFTIFALGCSLYANTERLFRTDNGGQFTCLNGMRAISMIWIIVYHSFRYLLDFKDFFFLSNIIDLKEIEEAPFAQIIISGLYGVDTFFLMSAFLLTYSFLNKLEKNNKLSKFEWAYFYIHRYWRLLPPYLFIILITVYILPFLGNGPLWDIYHSPDHNQECKDYMWAKILMLNNFFGTSCMNWLWYVPNDFQMYCISPLFLLILFKFPIAGIILLLSTLGSSITILAFLTENLYAQANKSLYSMESFFDDVYIKPYCRAGSWIIGMLLGYIFFKYKKIQIKNKFKKGFFILLGWSISTILGLTAIFGNYTNHAKNGRRMEIVEYGAFFSLTKVSFSISISWVIFACHYGFGGVINQFLSAPLFIPLARISYVAYLVHPAIIYAYYYSQEALFHGSGLTLIYLIFGNILFTILVSFLYTMIFEAPFIAIENLVVGNRLKGKKEKG